ncbi:MAG: Na+/H+ antiporter subunit E [Gammaproteobacteria bacterium]|nr:Na+/H+ antiporter subunit E [Gammaproteobacteria bacterium]
MKHAFSLFAVLAGLWILLSGEFQTLLLVLGVISAAGVCWLALRMDAKDGEYPVVNVRLLRLGRYWLWLIKEIVKANINVTREILRPELRLSPSIFRVPADGLSELGQVTYANSITLTPGTVSINIKDRHIEVHALIQPAADDLQRGEMVRRLRRLEPN